MTTTVEPNFLTPEVLSYIGRESADVPCPERLDRSTLRRYAQATHDTNPLYSDEAFARGSRYGELIAPPFYVARGFPPPLGQPPQDYNEPTTVDEDPTSTRVIIPGCPRLLNGGFQVEWFRPVYLGDQLYVRTRVANIEQKKGRAGPFVVVTTQRILRNQDSEVVAVATQTAIRMP
ncbi:MAG: MaoC family dehydratase N-terminal domain-containing protein [Chloroflexi bacterium]|nr:MaoC family dehydratase N-terminal domain-containing protein [Chloroflexota bacterium]